MKKTQGYGQVYVRNKGLYIVYRVSRSKGEKVLTHTCVCTYFLFFPCHLVSLSSSMYAICTCLYISGTL